VKPTLQIIAERTGVSKMTVSRILRNFPNHNPKTRDKVLEVAEELHYKKNPLVTALMTQVRDKKSTPFRTSIALIQSEPTGYTIHPNRVLLRNGISEEAAFHGFDVEPFNINSASITPDRLVQVLEARGFHCIIFEPFYKPNIRLEISLTKFAAISTSGTLTYPQLDQVNVDQHSGFMLAMEKLNEKGYERYGFVAGNISEALDQNRRLGAFLLSQSLQAKRNRIPVLWKVNNESAFKEQLEKWIKKYRPEAIVSAQSKIPELLEELGHKVPVDMGFIHLSLSDPDGQFTGINPDWYAAGAIAARQVIELLVANTPGPPKRPKITFIQPSWVEGNSLPQKFSPSYEVV
jgi:LacI family transcriptional regulator